MKIDRVMKVTLRRIQKTFLCKWQKHTETLRGQEQGGEILGKVIKRHFLRKRIEQWRSYVNMQKRVNYIQNFLENHDKYRAIILKSRVFKALVDYTANQKLAKFTLKKLLVTFQKSCFQRTLTQWKTFTYKTRMLQLKIDIEELDEEHNKNSYELSSLNNAIESTLAYNSSLSHRLLSQAHRILCNTYNRH